MPSLSLTGKEIPDLPDPYNGAGSTLPKWLKEIPLDEEGEFNISDEAKKAIPILHVKRPLYLLSPADVSRFDEEVGEAGKKEMNKYYLMVSYNVDSAIWRSIQPRTTEEIAMAEKEITRSSSLLYNVVKLFVPKDMERDVFIGLDTFFGMLGQLLAFKNPYHIEPVFMSNILSLFFWLVMFYIAWDEFRKIVRGGG